jgi:hypothetical protein
MRNPNSLNNKRINRLALFIVPVVFVFTVLYYLDLCGPQSTRNIDPEYAYLYNGISLGLLKLNVSHIDHPGTPLQVIFALVTRATHFVCGQGDYFTDVLLRSDFYFKIVHSFIIFLLGALLLFFGLKYYAVTGNPILAMLLQISPFLNISSFHVFCRIVPEMLALIPILGMFFLLLRYLYADPGQIRDRDAVFFALLSAFGLSVKLDFLPVIFVPVFILGKARHLAIYFAFMVIMFFIFAFPVLYQLETFTTWVKDLFIHSGSYGTGTADIINWSQWATNFKSLFSTYPVYIIIVGSLLMVYLLTFLLKRAGEKPVRILKGLLLCNILNVLIVSKQFAPHYTIPSVLLFPFSVSIMLMILFYQKKIVNRLSLLITIVVISFTLKSYKDMMKWKVPLQVQKQQVVQKCYDEAGESPLVLITKPYSTYFMESGLLFGWFFSGQLREPAQEILHKTLPGRYILSYSGQEFHLWNNTLTAEQLIDANNTLYIFIENSVQEQNEEMLNRFSKNMDGGCIYTNDLTADKLYRFHKE